MLKYLQEYRSPKDALRLQEKIRRLPLNGRRITLMEVCGSHTMAIHKFGIRELLPETVRLISGPGCPVCVTGMEYIDTALALAAQQGVIMATFGDMVKVPGSRSSLQLARSEGCDVRVVYSTLDALKLARENPARPVVFLAIGFETTAPTIAASLLEARRQSITNYSVLVAHKTMPPAMRALAADPGIGVQGYICPAHVSAVIGWKAYDFLPQEFGVACAVTGFEPLDILQGVYLLLRQVIRDEPRVDNEYSRVVSPDGNPAALDMLKEVFEPCDGNWRGVGMIPGSGLTLRSSWREYDATRRFAVECPPAQEPPGCICGDILKGRRDPVHCRLFGTVCTPEHPVGACMVSAEGTCAAWYKYR
ncbi:MAG: hydrogenase formation protein HypD [Acidobacteria bacterium]|nr:hydrogenase formation protein HypD [Acidobacteriota bacterium]